MGLSVFQIRQRWMTAAVAVAMLVGMAPTGLVAQEQLQRGATPAASQVSEPVLVVTLGSVNKLMQDVNYLSSIIGQPQAGGMFTMMAGTFTQGIDVNSPIGILVPLVDGVPEPIAMVPTPDAKVVLKRLEAQTGPVDELEDGTLVIAVGASTVYVRQVGNWAVLARNRALLEAAPADPSALFKGMGNDYFLAFRLKMQLVPAETRDMLVGQLRQGFEQAMQNQDNANAEASRDVAESTMKQLEQFIQDTDELMFGFNVDQPQRQVSFDVSFSAVPGTELAEMYGGQRPIPSRFASVIREDAAAYYHAATSISPTLVEQTRASVQTTINALKSAISNETELTPEQADDVQQLIEKVSNLAVSSIAEGKADVGAMLLADANKMQFVFGTFVSDGAEAAKIVQEVAEKVKNEPGAPTFEFNVGTHQDVTLHAMKVDVPESEDEARKIFGETAVLHIGTAPKAVYLAIGDGSESLLKQFIDSGANDTAAGQRPIGQLRVDMLPILQYIESIESNDVITAMMDALSRAPDQGRVRVVQEMVTNGQSSQMIISEGVLQAIGAAVRQSQMQAMQQQNGQF